MRPRYGGYLDMGVVAWNLALMPEEKREATLAEVLGAEDLGGTAADRTLVREMLMAMLRRKEEHFAENRRAIISYELVDRGHDFYLSVVSTT